MMLKIDNCHGTTHVCSCDNCVERLSLTSDKLPEGWVTLGKYKHLCPTCDILSKSWPIAVYWEKAETTYDPTLPPEKCHSCQSVR